MSDQLAVCKKDTLVFVTFTELLFFFFVVCAVFFFLPLNLVGPEDSNAGTSSVLSTAVRLWAFACSFVGLWLCRAARCLLGP